MVIDEGVSSSSVEPAQPVSANKPIVNKKVIIKTKMGERRVEEAFMVCITLLAEWM
ncbi:MAG: hypothetical protein ACOVPA_16975 [Rubrivivax sp.]